MLPGPNILRICTQCHDLITQATLCSGNSFGARLWTDGFRRAPMLPILPWLVECPHCRTLAWIDELPEKQSDGEANAPHGEAPSPERLHELLRKRPLSRTKKTYLRQQLWWAGNHPRREDTAPLPLSAEEVVNLEALARLLDSEDEEQRLQKAEIMRELGRFDDAAALLAFDFDEEFSTVSTRIRERVAARDPRVAEL